MGDKKHRDRHDRKTVEPTPEELEADSMASFIEGCPTCGNEDIQSAELLEAWKVIDNLEDELLKVKLLMAAHPSQGAGIGVAESTIPSDIDWKDRYAKIKAAYVKTRLEVSGSFGNWDYNTRKRVLEHEISTELGFVV